MAARGAVGWAPLPDLAEGRRGAAAVALPDGRAMVLGGDTPGPNIAARTARAGEGGIASVDHLIRLSELGVEGAVVGRALYTGDVELADAIIAVEAL